MSEQKDARKQVNFRLTDEEAMIIERKATEADLSISAYCKKVALDGKVKAPVLSREAGKAILPHISKIGSNLNQLTKKANSEGITLLDMGVDLESIQNQFNALWELILDGKMPKKEKVVLNVKEKADQQEKEKITKDLICPKCGEKVISVYSEKKGKNCLVCPNRTRQSQDHYFKWVE